MSVGIGPCVVRLENGFVRIGDDLQFTPDALSWLEVRSNSPGVCDAIDDMTWLIVGLRGQSTPTSWLLSSRDVAQQMRDDINAVVAEAVS